jgi:hypothetical protein
MQAVKPGVAVSTGLYEASLPMMGATLTFAFFNRHKSSKFAIIAQSFTAKLSHILILFYFPGLK